MPSARRIAANRRNAQKSCGPRTHAGKARVRRNALKHGLSLSVLKSPGMSAEVEKLALALVGNDQDSRLLMQARKLAEAAMDLQRIQVTKVALTNPHINQLKTANGLAGVPEGSAKDQAQEHHPDERTFDSNITGAALITALPLLVKIHRYECRARSRHARTFRLFVAYKAAAAALQDSR
jgi:hypothetical protein